MKGSGRAPRRVRVIDQVPDVRPRRARARSTAPPQAAKRSHVIDQAPDVDTRPPSSRTRARRSPALHVIPPDWSPLPGVPDRSECKDGPRPCRYIECKMHTWVITSEDREGKPWTNPARAPDGRWLPNTATTEPQRPKPVIRPYSAVSCAQDVADRARARGEQVPEDVIGDILGFSDRNTRYYVKRAEEKLRAMGAELRELLLELLEEETSPVMADGCRWVSSRVARCA